MASFTSPSTRASGYKVTAANWNELVNDLIFLGSGTASAGRPSVMATSTSTASLTQNTWIGAIAFDGADEWDTASMHDPSTNNSRLTCPTDGAGLYEVAAELYADAHNQFEAVHIMVRKNSAGSSTGGTFVSQSTEPFSTNGVVPTGIQIQTLVRLAVGDYVEVFVLSEASGEALIGTTIPHRFGMIWQTA